MNKKVWVRPVTEVQQFEANEYVAACGDTEYGVYKFKCDSPRGTVYYYDSDNNAQYVGGYKPCGDTHEAAKSEAFPKGFVDRNSNGKEDSGEAAIIWLEYGWTWGGYGIVNWHATENLDRDSWEVTKS